MKKIIAGKRYDTVTATCVASHSEGYGGDHSGYDESIYRTIRGNWFLAGSGGPASQYSVSVGQNSWIGGSDIIPLTKQEAQDWLEANDCVEELERYFIGSIVEA